jgi:5-methyltetrahydrofolate--homocysteine methyltransferase
MADLAALSDMLQKGKAKETEQMTKDALAEGVSPKDVLEKALVHGMGIIGKKFQNNEIYVPEVLIAARAMSRAMAVLEPAMMKAGVAYAGTVALATVKGDLHDIGKNLVAMMFKGAGFKVIDLGIDAGPEKFIEACKEHKPQLLGLSALLTTTMPSMKDIIEGVRAAGFKDVKVIIGGAPVTQAYSDEIGADGYSPDAASAVDLGKKLLGIK